MKTNITGRASLKIAVFNFKTVSRAALLKK